ncbi:glycosyltransferase [Trichormus variabilis ARAD]|uniref:Glycosyltransferase n=1 Tax=Trichormus variabilis N2B TaxID=2681315 RepID=A0ABR6SDR7_ANAVA|nr:MULTISPECIES: glycosyltransferase [Nostocaceae]MBC1213823.1 glycosyltransferase [Trichormus variabilis ARAD]MBC1270132.1 glycosyltransferase [Trichormus variabilis FSR]MBC1304520.1 glycosyltransferase [Trichormus variabilis N2B]MBC1312191.1 glycosyltransferase [Trichormus variabilis PNB]QFZ11700.1 glycosyltransferase [Anabaena sp. YBS01]
MGISKVLLTNHHLKSYAGSELVTLDLAIEFQQKGWSVTVATFLFGGDLARHFYARGIDVVNVLEKPLTENEFDLVWGHHFPVLIKCLIEDSVKTKYLVLSSLSPYEPLEAIPFFYSKSDLILCNSEETKKEIIEQNHLQEIDKNKLFVFNNSVPANWFNLPVDIKETELRKVGVISNHPPTEVLTAIDILKSKNIDVDLIGILESPQLVNIDILNSYDAIITIGRTVQHCMALGKPVFCYDHFGGPGWLTPDNFKLAEWFNYSGRCCYQKMSGEQIVENLINGFLANNQHIHFFKNYSLENYSLTRNVENVLSCINNINKDYVDFNSEQVIGKVGEAYRRVFTENGFLKLERERSQSQLQQTQTELERSQSQLQQTQTELERSQSQLQQTQTELERSQSQLQQTQTELTLSQSQLYITQTKLEHWKNLVSWMEGSKFWKLRALSLSIKKGIINLPILKLAFNRLPVFQKKNYPIFIKRIGKWLKHQIMNFRTRNEFADALLAKVLQNFSGFPEYSQWIKDYEAKDEELTQQKKNSLLFHYQPVLSIVFPVYKLPLTVLQETINSVIQQTYSNWELCIAFADIDNYQTIDYLKTLSLQEKRIKLKVMAENKGISGNSNVSLDMASGEFVALLDHDDLLAPFAFYEVISELNKQPDLDFIYSDKDCISANSMVRSRLLLKPEWSPEILYSANYLTHLCIARRTLLEKIGGFRPETDGAQDWDLFLRITENTSRIARINSVLYHWRIIQGSTSLGIDSKPYALEGQLRSIQDHLTRTKLPATVSPHPESGFRLEWQASPATVSIYIDGDVPWDSLLACINAVAQFSDPKLHKAKITLPEHTYTSKATERENLIKAISLPIDWLPIKEGNSKLVTLANNIKQDKTDVVVFVSGLVKRFTEGWIQELSGWVLNHPDIGFVSSLILTDNNLVVEAGLVVDKYDNGSPLMRGNFLYSWDIFGGALWYRNCSASSPWAIAFSYKNYLEVGGLSSNSPSLSHAMIKLCQAIRANNKRGLVNPHARAFLQDLPKNDIPEFDDSLGNDPYFHPAFASVVPLKLRVKNGKKN